MDFQPASGSFGKTATIVTGMAGGRHRRRSCRRFTGSRRCYGAKPKSFRKRRSLRKSSSRSKNLFGW